MLDWGDMLAALPESFGGLVALCVGSHYDFRCLKSWDGMLPDSPRILGLGGASVALGGMMCADLRPRCAANRSGANSGCPCSGP